jgi:hypothetical protein
VGDMRALAAPPPVVANVVACQWSGGCASGWTAGAYREPERWRTARIDGPGSWRCRHTVCDSESRCAEAMRRGSTLAVLPDTGRAVFKLVNLRAAAVTVG